MRTCCFRLESVRTRHRWPRGSYPHHFECHYTYIYLAECRYGGKLGIPLMIGHRKQLHQVKPKSPTSELTSIECQLPHIVAIGTLCGRISRLVVGKRTSVAVDRNVFAGIDSSTAGADKLQSHSARIGSLH